MRKEKEGMERLNLIMPMGGGGTRFGREGFGVPKPLIELRGRPFFYWAAQSVAAGVELESLTFVVLQQQVTDFQIDERIREFYPEAGIVVIPRVLPGALCTCLEGCAGVGEGKPLLFNDCDHLFLSREFYGFCAEGRFEEADGGVLTFSSSDPRFSYLRYGPDGGVSGTAEKEVVSGDAICGAYYFRNAEVFREAADIYLKRQRYSEYFVSGVYDVMVEQGKRVRGFATDVHLSFGTPQEYEEARREEGKQGVFDRLEGRVYDRGEKSEA